MVDLPHRGLGKQGSALVVMDGDRATLAVVRVRQEMGLSVDIAANREAALPWTVHTNYAVVVCGGSQQAELSEFAIGLHRDAPHTRVILFAEPGLDRDRLEELGGEVLTAPADVNALVDRLWPPQAR